MAAFTGAPLLTTFFHTWFTVFPENEGSISSQPPYTSVRSTRCHPRDANLQSNRLRTSSNTKMSVFQAVCSVHFFLCKTERGKATWYERNPRETQVSEKTVALVDQSGGTEMCFRFSVWGAAFDSLDSYSKGFFHFSFDISLRLPADVLTIHTDNSRFCCIHCYVPYVAVY
jgi:hypothetical protein